MIDISENEKIDVRTVKTYSVPRQDFYKYRINGSGFLNETRDFKAFQTSVFPTTLPFGEEITFADAGVWNNEGAALIGAKMKELFLANGLDCRLVDFQKHAWAAGPTDVRLRIFIEIGGPALGTGLNTIVYNIYNGGVLEQVSSQFSYQVSGPHVSTDATYRSTKFLESTIWEVLDDGVYIPASAPDLLQPGVVLLTTTNTDVGGDLLTSDTVVYKAKNLLSTQLTSLEYLQGFGIDLKYFLSDDFRFQNESFRAYLVESLANNSINVESVETQLETLYAEYMINITPVENTTALISR